MARLGRLRGRAADRWDRRTTFEVIRSIDIAGAPATVWRLVWAPQYAPLLDDAVLKGWTVPGTPQGEVGERQAYVWSIDGKRIEIVLEVIELEPGSRAVVEHVPSNGVRTTTSVSTGDGHTRLEVGHYYRVTPLAEAQLAPGWRESTIQMYEDQLDRYLVRVRDLVEDGWRPEQD